MPVLKKQTFKHYIISSKETIYPNLEAENSTSILPDNEKIEEGSETSGGDELYEHHRYHVDAGQGPVRIDKFITDRLTRVSRNKVQNAIRSGNVLINDQTIKPNYKVRPLDTVRIVLPQIPNEMEVVAEDIPLDVVYEDDDVMVINKPCGMVVHPGLGNFRGTLVNALAFRFQGRTDLPVLEGNDSNRPCLVHRIDKDTSGLILVAKNEYSMAHLARQFFEHSVHRRYVALVWGDVVKEEGTVTGHIARNPKNDMQMIVFPDGLTGKHAITHYKVLERFYYTTLVECRLETGRTHQIRVHMKHLGHTLFNDARYGGNEILKGTVYTKYKQFVYNCFKAVPRQALHARELGFTHPTTGERMLFECPIPSDMSAALDKWRGYINARKTFIEQEMNPEVAQFDWDEMIGVAAPPEYVDPVENEEI